MFLFISAPVALHFSLSLHSIAMINVTMRCFPTSLFLNIVMLLRSISVLAGQSYLSAHRLSRDRSPSTQQNHD